MNGDTLYGWQELNEDGWGLIATVNPAVTLTPVPLVTRSPEVAAQLEAYAEMHHISSGHPIRLARFSLAEVLEERA